MSAHHLPYTMTALLHGSAVPTLQICAVTVDTLQAAWQAAGSVQQD